MIVSNLSNLVRLTSCLLLFFCCIIVVYTIIQLYKGGLKVHSDQNVPEEMYLHAGTKSRREQETVWVGL